MPDNYQGLDGDDEILIIDEEPAGTGGAEAAPAQDPKAEAEGLPYKATPKVALPLRPVMYIY